jgi:anthranilate phosphoribosyltransferase
VNDGFADAVLRPLVAGTDLERDAARDALAQILSGRVDPLQVAGFLTAMTMKGETVPEMTGFIDAMIDAAVTFSLGPEPIDVVGTGGDQLHTVNITTMSALAVAGCGVAIAKHGNRAASSSVGSADVLEGLGVRLDVSADVVADCVREAGIGFMFAPAFHLSLAGLGPIRRSLRFRTVFNILGPLANPALVERTLVGVAPRRLLEPMAEVLQARGIRRAIMVSADDGLDELSLGSPSTIAVVNPESIVVDRLDAGRVLGLRHSPDSLRGGDVAANVAAVRRFVRADPGPAFDVACANAALALMVAERTDSLVEGFEMAAASVREGRAAAALERLIEVSNS